MGIDVYMKWDTKPEPPDNHDPAKGETWGDVMNAPGVYIRESYFAGPFAGTKVLMPETFAHSAEDWNAHHPEDHPGPWGDSLPVVLTGSEGVVWHDDGTVSIPAALLVARLEGTVITTKNRYEFTGYEDESADERERQAVALAADPWTPEWWGTKQFIEFVEKYRELEDAGLHPRITNSY